MNLKENKMGVMPVKRLLVSMSLPIMISMLIQALYNVVDSIFVAQINEKALTAVSLAFPLQNLMVAVAVGTGVGVNALLSRSLGEKNFEESNRAANNGILLALLSYLVFLIFGLFFTEIYFKSQTNDAEIIKYGIEYLSICTMASVGVFGQIIMERLLTSTGKTFLTMITQGTGAIINIVLDPILIFGLLGMPKLGVTGAALATVLGQIIAFIVAIILNAKFNDEVKLQFKGFRPNLNTIKKIYSVGFPSIIMLSITSVTTYCLNNILLKFSSTAAAVLGIYYKLQSIVFMPVFGINNGMVPIVAYNYGANNRERLTETIKLSIKYAIVIMLLALGVFQTIPQHLLSLFNASEEMLRLGVPALRIISLSYIFAGVSVVAGSVFQALGNGFLSLMTSIGRQLVILIPIAYLFSLTNDVNMVWWAYPIAEVASVILSVIFLTYIYNSKIKAISETKEKCYMDLENATENV